MALSSFQAWQTPLLILAPLCLPPPEEPLSASAERRWDRLENRRFQSQPPIWRRLRVLPEVLMKEEFSLK